MAKIAAKVVVGTVAVYVYGDDAASFAALTAMIAANANSAMAALAAAGIGDVDGGGNTDGPAN